MYGQSLKTPVDLLHESRPRQRVDPVSHQRMDTPCLCHQDVPRIPGQLYGPTTKRLFTLRVSRPHTLNFLILLLGGGTETSDER